MDISGISAGGAVSAALAQKEAGTEAQVQVTMLKKALDTQTEGALALLDALPQASNTQGLPANLGQNINTKA
ncbi:hypothetical protein THMIRHAS_12800 [Thiosulfatimonas sediminis]|uniref:Motility protein n=1 Tax=Thiosulfatimonas sediminis TaxID=2675054 RepID=A0A6F8PV45_9GAMM|nr:YjfB family protein [Thiosulfatimonas sediminis]BBP45907.1 hypothetical protein THMIRHAS_12800 [Thiosulfatimonas sediminis]